MKIILGTWPMSGDFGKYNKEDSTKLLKYCYQKGYREFDVAPNYGFGKSEEILGEAFYNKEVLINTKIGNNSQKKKSFSVRFLEKSFYQSLYRLKRRSVNILFVHNPRRIRNIEKIVSFLKKLKKAKLINDYGLSVSKDYEYKKNIFNKFKILQVDYNLIYQKLLFEKKYSNKKIYCRSPLASGLLNDKRYSKFAESDQRKIWLKPKRLKNIYKFIDEFKIIKNYSIKELAILFLKKNNFSNSVIFGCRNLKQFKQIERVVNSKKNLTINEFKLINKIYLEKNENHY
jgi:aryl-alcohol dehydrogenase-like predicted oxidoreductase